MDSELEHDLETFFSVSVWPHKTKFVLEIQFHLVHRRQAICLSLRINKMLNLYSRVRWIMDTMEKVRGDNWKGVVRRTAR